MPGHAVGCQHHAVGCTPCGGAQDPAVGCRMRWFGAGPRHGVQEHAGGVGPQGWCRTTKHIWDQAFQFSPVFINLLPIDLTRGSFTPRVPTSGAAFHTFPLLLAQTLHPEALPHYSPLTEAFLGAGGRVPSAPRTLLQPRLTAGAASWQQRQGQITLCWARRSHPSSSIKPSFKKHFAKCPADTGGPGRLMPPAPRRARCQRVASKGHGGHAGPPRPLPAGGAGDAVAGGMLCSPQGS